jgi:hypothetical protein
VCRSEDGNDFALASEGEHKLIAVDPKTGRHAETRIRIRFL